MDQVFGSGVLRGGAEYDDIRFTTIDTTPGVTGSIDGGASFDTMIFDTGLPVAIVNGSARGSIAIRIGAAGAIAINYESIILDRTDDHVALYGVTDRIEIHGQGGADRLAGSGAVALYGDEGDDRITLVAASGLATEGEANGGEGDDTLVLTGAFVVDLAAGTATAFDGVYAVAEFEAVETGGGAIVQGSDAAERLSVVADGGTAGVRFHGGGGDDILRGGAGDDVLEGGDGDDAIVGGGGRDRIDGGAGNDIVDLRGGSAAGAVVTLGAGADTLILGRSGVVVTDFAAGDGGDRIDLSAFGSPAALFAGGQAVLRQAGGDTAIVVDGQVVATLHGVAPAKLTDRNLGIGRQPDGAIGHRDAAHDFDGDGRSDILWRNADGALTTWFRGTDGTITAGATDRVSIDWKVAGTGDFDGDGRDDILWRNDDGTLASWRSIGTGFDGTGGVNLRVGTDWHVAGVADLNGDGRADIVWHSDGGAMTAWLSTDRGFDGTTFGVHQVGTDWTIAATGDQNGDGRADIAWRNGGGDFTMWLSGADGFDGASVGVFAVGAQWQVQGMADFDGDGRDDILWRSADGLLTSWRSAGTGFDAAMPAYAIDRSWAVAGVGDVDGDGRGDAIWRSGGGDTTIWFGTGAGGFDGTRQPVVAVGTDWHIML